MASFYRWSRFRTELVAGGKPCMAAPGNPNRRCVPILLPTSPSTLQFWLLLASIFCLELCSESLADGPTQVGGKDFGGKGS